MANGSDYRGDLGRTSLKGGQGTVIGTVFGTLLMAVVSNGLSLLNVSGYWERVVVERDRACRCSDGSLAAPGMKDEPNRRADSRLGCQVNILARRERLAPLAQTSWTESSA